MRVVTYGFGMRSPIWRVGAALAVLVAALAVGGCVEDDPDTTPSPDPTSTPLFESDEEALTAAEEAYARYQAVSDAILMDGGADPERLLEVATEEQYRYEKNGFDRAASSKHHSTGGSKFRSMRIQSISENQVDVYFCEDVSLVDILDEAGVSVVSATRPDVFPRTASFVSSSGGVALIVSAIDEWSGEDFCSQ